MTVEMIERIAIAANGGSFANEHTKQYLIKQLVRGIGALTVADLHLLLLDKSK